MKEDMQEKITQRLHALQQEYDKGQKLLADLQNQAADVQGQLLRISGAMQVLQELLADAADETNRQPAVTPAQAAASDAR